MPDHWYKPIFRVIAKVKYWERDKFPQANHVCGMD